MMRRKRPSLRGSVSQNRPVRVRDDAPRLSLLVRLGVFGGVVLVALLLGLWSYESGWLHRQNMAVGEATLHLTQRAHFTVKDISVEGRQHTDKDQLYAAIETVSGAPILGFNPRQAEARIAKLPWVASVSVERHLPDTIFVHLTEREPMARWQHDEHIVVIDTQGKPLADANPDQFAALPLVVGVGAPDETPKLLNQLHQFPEVESRATSAVRVGERRWDLHLQPKVVVRLPDHDVVDALKRLSVLITEQKILDRDIAAIDLRLDDRLTIESNDDANAPHTTSGNKRL
jgi:cell division protein FtsQ